MHSKLPSIKRKVLISSEGEKYSFWGQKIVFNTDSREMISRNVNRWDILEALLYWRCSSRNVYLLLEALEEKSLCLTSKSKLQKQQTKLYSFFPERGVGGRFYARHVTSDDSTKPLRDSTPWTITARRIRYTRWKKRRNAKIESSGSIKHGEMRETLVKRSLITA